MAHHHLAIAILFLIAGHTYKTNFGIGHSIKEILKAHKGPFTGEGHKGIYEILTTLWHAQLALKNAWCKWLSTNSLVFNLLNHRPQINVMGCFYIFSNSEFRFEKGS